MPTPRSTYNMYRPIPPPHTQDRAKLEGDRRKAEVKQVEDDRRAKAAEVAGQRAAAEDEKQQRDEAVRRRKAEEEARKKDAEKQARVSADSLFLCLPEGGEEGHGRGMVSFIRQWCHSCC